jgi:hypothetical protein
VLILVRQSQISQSVVAQAVTMRMSSALPHHSRKTFASSGVPLRSRVRMKEFLTAWTADFRAGRTETAGSQALQRAHGAIQLPREVDFADVAVENRRGWI